MTVPGTKLSQIALAGAPPALSDTLVGVGGGTADKQYTLAQVQTAIAGSSSPGAPVHSVQFNNPLGTFAGSADFTWVSGTGLTIGGATETLGVVTPGVGGEHVAIGNYAVVNTLTFPPTAGGTVYTGTFPLIVSEKIEGDLSAFSYSPQLITGWGSYKHTGINVATVAGIDAEIFILSDSTGPFYQATGLQFVGDNRGSGDLSALDGANMTAKHSGSGTIGFFTGLYLDLIRQSGGPVTDSYGVYIDSPYLTGPTAAWGTNTGLYIATQASVGTTSSYNILSAGTSFITPASTVGGNLFQGHTAIGNYADVDHLKLAPGDPVNVSSQNKPTVLGLSDFQTGDLSGINLDSVAIYTGWRHTGASAALTFLGLDVEPTINSNSTGPINSVGAMYFGPKAYAGAIGYLWGSYGQVTNNGATVGEGDGLASNVANNSGTIAQACALHAWQNSGPGITASYGLLIEDQTGSGTASYNILSAGTRPADAPALSGTIGGNLFINNVGIGEYADVNNKYWYAGGDPVNSSDGGTAYQTLQVDSFTDGDGTTLGDAYGLYVGQTFKHTTGFASCKGVYANPVIASNSTGDIDSASGLAFQLENYGSGTIAAAFGLQGEVLHYSSGSGDITLAAGGEFRIRKDGHYLDARTLWLASHSGGTPNIGNYYGLYVDDHSGIGTSVSENIHSVGASSITKFEGHHYQGNYYETTEVTAPAAPPANGVRIYAQDNGAGKTQLMALFNTGAAQQIAIQP